MIDPQYHWEWKDEEDYRDGIREGGILEEWVKGIEQTQDEVFNRINQRLYPLDGAWLGWRPDLSWVPPKLPERWQIV